MYYGRGRGRGKLVTNTTCKTIEALEYMSQQHNTHAHVNLNEEAWVGNQQRVQNCIFQPESGFFSGHAT